MCMLDVDVYDAVTDKLFYQQLCLLLYTSIPFAVGSVESNTSTCACQRACLSDLAPDTTVGLPVYYHDGLHGGCVQLKRGCSLSSEDCGYTSLTDCQSACGSAIGGCASTQNGCCPDGSVRYDDGHCGESVTAKPLAYLCKTSYSTYYIRPPLYTCRIDSINFYVYANNLLLKH